MGNKDCRLTVGKGYGFLRPDGGKPAELERATFGRESGYGFLRPDGGKPAELERATFGRESGPL